MAIRDSSLFARFVAGELVLAIIVRRGCFWTSRTQKICQSFRLVRNAIKAFLLMKSTSHV
jgi:hypothetical protein